MTKNCAEVSLAFSPSLVQGSECAEEKVGVEADAPVRGVTVSSKKGTARVGAPTEQSSEPEIPSRSESESEVKSKTRAKRSRPPSATPRPSALYDTVEAAAEKLSLDPSALRARLRRAQRAEGRAIVADLGGGITAFKFGSSWRISFPQALLKRAQYRLP